MNGLPTPVQVLMVSSLFGERKIAEPMGIGCLTASLRRTGFHVAVLEPSLEGLTVDETVDEVSQYIPQVIGISMLRDKHVGHVHRLVVMLRKAHPNAFITVGGHGPSIAVRSILPGSLRPACRVNAASETKRRSVICSSSRPADVCFSPAIVDPGFTDRGKGAGDLGTSSGANELDDSPYFDKTSEYLDILSHIDTYVLGEADDFIPETCSKRHCGK